MRKTFFRKIFSIFRFRFVFVLIFERRKKFVPLSGPSQQQRRVQQFRKVKHVAKRSSLGKNEQYRQGVQWIESQVRRVFSSLVQRKISQRRHQWRHVQTHFWSVQRLCQGKSTSKWLSNGIIPLLNITECDERTQHRLKGSRSRNSGYTRREAKWEEVEQI